jgi:ribose transport system substrate-binding protein
LVASYNAIDKAKEAILAGTLQATVDQLPMEQGYQGLVYALKALRGESLPEITLVDNQRHARALVRICFIFSVNLI